MSEHNMQHLVLHYLDKRWSVAGLKARAQPLDVRKTSLNYRQSELEKCVSYTLWLLKPTLQVQGPYANIESKQVKCNLLRDSKHVYGNQNTARRTSTSLKKIVPLLHLDIVPLLHLALLFGAPESISLSLCWVVNESRRNSHRADSLRCYKRLG